MSGNIVHGDALEYYGEWPSPTVIVSDGAYGVQNNTFEGDPEDPTELREWYEPHIKAWAEHATPSTTLWFWCSDIGWAHLHHVLTEHGWEYRGVNIWDKGMEHIAGNCNTQSMRKFPQVTELCVHYVRSKEAILSLDDDERDVQQWMRDEWERTGLPFSEANEACGVEEAATRKYLTSDSGWYFPPPERFERLRQYANEHGDPDGRPYFDAGELPYDADALDDMAPVVDHRAKFDCPAGVTNVWREGHTDSRERVLDDEKAAHPNQKPLVLMERILRSASEEGDAVWEPFGGLCTATVAASRLDRDPYAAELQEEYVEHARRRLRNVTTIEGVGQERLGSFATEGGQNTSVSGGGS